MKIIKYFFQFLIICLLLVFFKILGYKRALIFGSLIGRIFGRLIRSKKIILKNLSYIYKNSKIDQINKEEIVDEVYSNYGKILSEYVFLEKFRNGILKQNVTIKGKDHLEKIKLDNKKVIFVSGHFSNFELMAMFIDDAGIKLSTIYRPLNNFFLNRIMEKIRIKYICRNQIKKGKSGTRQIISDLKNNFSIALMIDQRVSEGIKCDFFGVPAFTTTIPAQIVKKFGCEIIPVHIERYDQTKFVLSFEKPIKFGEKLTTEEITLQLNKILERMIVKNPSQWILTHNRWK